MTTWNSRGWAIALAIGLFGLLVPAQADAACAGWDRAGTWKMYLMRSDSVDSGWTKCSVKVTSGGTVKSGKCTQKDAVTGAIQTAKVDGGTIKIGRSCKVTGSFTIAGCENTIAESWLSEDKIMMSGVGTDCDNFLFQFNAVKR